MDLSTLIDEYAVGADVLRLVIKGFTPAQLTAHPVPNKWSVKEVICHIADFEPVYADRMKRVIAEDEPQLLSGNPDLFAARLAYAERDIEEDLALIDAVRKHMARILRTLSPEDFQRVGMHTTDGPLTLETLLKRITAHLPHHVKFIEEKRKALQERERQSFKDTRRF